MHNVGIDHLFTERFNQDIIENFFAHCKSTSSFLSTSHFRPIFQSSRMFFASDLPEGSNCEDDGDCPLFAFSEDDDSFFTTEETVENELASYFSNFNPTINGSITFIRFF